MHRPLRLKKQELDEVRIHKILDAAFHGVLSTVSEDGTPYGVPLNYILSGNTLYFHCAQKGHKIDNINRNPTASFVVVGATKPLPEFFTARYESVIAFGTVRFITGAQEKAQVMRLLCQKYMPEVLERANSVIPSYLSKLSILEMTIERLSGKTSED